MSPAPPAIAFVTMVRDDHVFLRIWVEYYARHVPRQNLFILLDGFDQVPPDFTAGCQILTLPRSDPGPGWDVRRWKMLADFNTMLLGRFDVVVLNDVDEIIVPDPSKGVSLLDALGRAREVGVITPFAVEVVHRFDLCPEPIDLSRPILKQRPHVRVNERYAKPCVTSVPVRWNLGGHMSDFETLNLDESLFLFHLRFFDRIMLLERQKDRLAITMATQPGKPEVAGGGWSISQDEIQGFLLSLQTEGPPAENNFDFSQKRRRMKNGWRKERDSHFWRLGTIFERRRTYLVPDRFFDAF